MLSAPRTLDYRGFAITSYVNELEDGDSAADSYVVLGVDQVKVADEVEV